MTTDEQPTLRTEHQLAHGSNQPASDDWQMPMHGMNNRPPQSIRTRTRRQIPTDPYPGRRRQVSATYRGEIRAVPLRDVIYLLADQKYVTVRHPGGELLADESLRFFERTFADLFLRIHRNALVARDRLLGLETTEGGVVLAQLRDCDTRLPISRRHLARIRRWLDDGDL